MNRNAMAQTKVYRAARRKRRPKGSRKFSWWLIGLAVVAIGAFVLGGAAYKFLSGFQPETKPASIAPRSAEENLNVLVMGVDSGVNGSGNALGRTQSQGPQRSDVLFLVSINQKTREAGVISIPRDSRVTIPGRTGYDKVAHAHVWGGPDLVLETVTRLLEVPIHHYVKVDFKGFEEVVDALGGIEIDIKQRMYYVDPYQDLTIDLQPGKQVLDGEKALQFVRYRQYPEGDIARIEAQHQFLNSVVDKLFQMRTVWKLPALAEALSKHVETDMTPAEIMSLAKTAASFDESRLSMTTLPGRNATLSDGNQSLSYWVIDRHEAQKIVNRYVFGIDPDRNAKISVEVLNGTGVQGLASDLGSRLGDMSFRVLTLGNASSTGHSTTELHFRDGLHERELVEECVLRALHRIGLKSAAVKSGKEPGDGSEPAADVTIVVGRDYLSKRSDGS